MMTCEKCGKNTHVIFITKNKGKICNECKETTCYKINGKKCKEVIDNMMKRRL